MMQFEIVKQALIDLLGDNENGQFQTIGFQRQSKNAKEVKGIKRFVQVFYKDGDFPKSGGSPNGPKKHDATYSIEFTTSESAKVDVSTLNNESATAAQKQIALAGLAEAADLADKSFDELVRIVYQILMDSKNKKIGLPTGTISNQWIPRIQKDQTVEGGDLVVITGNMNFTCSMSDEVQGATPVTGDKIIDSQIDIDGDDVEKTGATVTT